MLQVVRRLKLRKRKLKKLNAKSFRNLVTESEMDREALRQA